MTSTVQRLPFGRNKMKVCHETRRCLLFNTSNANLYYEKQSRSFTCRVRSSLKTHTITTACDAKQDNFVSDQKFTIVYVLVKIACVFIQVDMKLIEIAFGSQ